MNLTPYYEEDGITIYCGDNRKIAAMLDDLDLLLTDPPYGLRDKLQGGTWGKSFEGDYKDWDASTPPDWALGMMIAKTKNQILWGGELLPQFTSVKRLVGLEEASFANLRRCRACLDKR